MMSFLSKPISGLAGADALGVLRVGEAHIDHLTWSPRSGEKPIAGLHQIVDVLHLLGGARRVGAGLAALPGAVTPSTATATDRRLIVPGC